MTRSKPSATSNTADLMAPWSPPLALYFDGAPSLRIWFGYLAYDAQSGTYPTDACLEALGPADHVFLFLTWHRLGFDSRRLAQYARFPCQVCLCANTQAEYDELCAAGVRCLHFNHCAAIDERIFRILWAEEEGAGAGTSALEALQERGDGAHSRRPFRLVVNSAFAPYKRLHLAAGTPGVASIGYWPEPGTHPTGSPCGTCLNLLPSSDDGGSDGAASSRSACRQGRYSYLQPAEVAAALNRCEVGGVLSEEEGTCWASTEMLLCGLPVVSTPSRGGREVWYSGHNSVIVEPTPEAVARGVDLAISRLASGAFNRAAIRAEALALAATHRERLHAQVQGLFDAHGVQLDARRYFAQRFVHKMGL